MEVLRSLEFYIDEPVFLLSACNNLSLVELQLVAEPIVLYGIIFASTFAHIDVVACYAIVCLAVADSRAYSKEEQDNK